MLLVTWIAIYVKLLIHLKVYVDDSYSFKRADNMKFYAPYNKSYIPCEIDQPVASLG